MWGSGTCAADPPLAVIAGWGPCGRAWRRWRSLRLAAGRANLRAPPWRPTSASFFPSAGMNDGGRTALQGEVGGSPSSARTPASPCCACGCAATGAGRRCGPGGGGAGGRGTARHRPLGQRTHQFGRRFKADQLELSSPQSPDGIIFLASGLIEGVDPVFGRAHRGEVRHRRGGILDTESRRLEVEGIGGKKRRGSRPPWEQQRAVLGCGVPPCARHLDHRAVRIHKTSATRREVIERNPTGSRKTFSASGSRRRTTWRASLVGGRRPAAPQA